MKVYKILLGCEDDVSDFTWGRDGEVSVLMIKM